MSDVGQESTLVRHIYTALFGHVIATTPPPPDACFGETAHLHHADLDAGTGLTRDGLDHRHAAVGVFRPDRQEEGLKGDNR